MSAFLRKMGRIGGVFALVTLLGVAATITSGSAATEVPAKESKPEKESQPLLSDVTGFRIVGGVKQLPPSGDQTHEQLKATAEARYVSDDGLQLQVSLVQYETDSAAYAKFTNLRKASARDLESQHVGTASAAIDRGVIFFRGTATVTVVGENENQRSRVLEFARALAATLDDGEGDVPVLVKHLPNWETSHRQALYAVKSGALVATVPNQPILNEVNFDGGTESVTANYGQSQLVIVEFTTPQFSVDNDQRISTKIAELKSQGQPTPNAYRRVGNYSVFVFNAADEKSANALIDQVKYEQVVQWLGDDPHLYEKMQRYFAQTSAGVLVAVLQSSGLSLLFCLAAGALIGTMLFRRRRAQRAAAFSDAGGSVRLNLDNLTGPANSRLLESGTSRDSANS